MNNNTSAKEEKSSLYKDIIKRMLQVFSLLIFTTVVLFLSAGTIRWEWGWLYILIYLIYIIVNSMILPKELIAERGKLKSNVKKWDKLINKLNIIPGLGLIIICGLDKRFRWSPDWSKCLHLLGLVIFVSGSAIFTLAMIYNRFFSTLVRIQFDREHRVATSGPYKIVRHPGYAGFILASFGVPLILGSLWAFIPVSLTCILFVIRTFLEDRTLFLELDGYKEFAERTRYKLIPFLW